MMSIAPDRGPPAARPDAAPVARFERPPRRGRYGTAGLIALVFELGPAGHSYECGIARIALYGFRRHRSAGFQFAGGRARDSGQRVQAGADDQLRSRARAVARAAGPLAAEFDERIGTALPVAAIVILDWLHQFSQRRAHGCATLRIEQAVQPDDAVLRLSDVQVAALVSAVRLRQRARGIDAMFEVLGHRRELAGVHR